jgi:hypothetical protein
LNGQTDGCVPDDSIQDRTAKKSLERHKYRSELVTPAVTDSITDRQTDRVIWNSITACRRKLLKILRNTWEWT